MAKNPGPGAYDHEPPEMPVVQRLPGGKWSGDPIMGWGEALRVKGIGTWKQRSYMEKTSHEILSPKQHDISPKQLAQNKPNHQPGTGGGPRGIEPPAFGSDSPQTSSQFSSSRQLRGFGIW